MSKVLMKGNEAFGAAAIRGGCNCYFGYPITPQNEVPEYMSHELPKAGGKFLQAESELAAISMAYGAAAAGGRVFVSTSGPGLALMQEGLGFICSAEVPIVAMNVMRGGPGIGGIQPGQADYWQVTRGGYNGDAQIPVFAPATIQECVDYIYEAFDIADAIRNPVLILADGMLGQMMEPVELPEPKERTLGADVLASKPWAVTGTDEHEGRNLVVSLHLDPAELEEHCEHLWDKYAAARDMLTRYVVRDVDEAEVVFVAFGTMSRICAEACELLAERGIKAGMVRPISLRPFPEVAFDELGANTKLIISAELSMGQMIQDIKAAVCGRWPVELINRTGGIVPTSREVAERTVALLAALDEGGRA